MLYVIMYFFFTLLFLCIYISILIFSHFTFDKGRTIRKLMGGGGGGEGDFWPIACARIFFFGLQPYARIFLKLNLLHAQFATELIKNSATGTLIHEIHSLFTLLSIYFMT